MFKSFNELPNSLKDKIFDFIEDLEPDDKGCEKINSILLVFEGFTDECWYDVCRRGLSPSALERELLHDFGRHAEENGLKHNITGICRRSDDGVAYAVFC